MSSSLIKGKYVLCKVNTDDTVEVIKDGAVFQQNGEIIDVGRYETLRARHTAGEEIGSDQHMVLPGLVNAHQHGRGVSHLLRGVADDFLESWRLVGCRPVDHYLNTMYCIARLIESGVTTVMHSHPLMNPDYEEGVMSTLKAYQDGGIRVAFALGIRNQSHLVYADDQEFLSSLPRQLRIKGRKYLDAIRVPEEEYFSLFTKLCEEHGNTASPKVKIFHAPIGPQWCSDELLIRIRESSDEYDTGIHTHMLETLYQKTYALETFGKSLVEHLSDIGFLCPRTSFGHCVWLTERDIELLAHTGASVCHNPGSNLRLKSGIAPVNQMLASGVNVALGTDNFTINDDEDMLTELRLCANLHRIPVCRNPSPAHGQLLKMITTNGAKVTLFSDQVGTLEKGKRADIVLIDLKNISEPYLDPELGILCILSAFLGRAKGSDVDTVVVDGEVVFRNKKHIRINRDEVVAGLTESLSRALKPSDVERRRFELCLSPYILDFYRDWEKPQTRPFYVYNSTI